MLHGLCIGIKSMELIIAVECEDSPAIRRNFQIIYHLSANKTNPDKT